MQLFMLLRNVDTIRMLAMVQTRGSSKCCFVFWCLFLLYTHLIIGNLLHVITLLLVENPNKDYKSALIHNSALLVCLWYVAAVIINL